MQAQRLILQHGVHGCRECVGIVNTHGTIQFNQVLGLLELVVLGTKNHGNAIDGRLVDVVDAHTKSAAHVGRLAIAIER